MGKPVNLTAEQQELRDRLCEMDRQLWSVLKKEAPPLKQDDLQKRYEEMAETAHKLHMSLKESGHEPRHHKYMLKNRGVSAENVEFYNHIHPVDDLLRFIDDENANDDPGDTTIGKEFTLRVYTKHRGHYDYYFMTRTQHGWNFQEGPEANSAECGKDGRPDLYDALDHDTVCYPNQIGEYFEYLWEQASQGLTDQKVQECFDMLGDWISSCEMNAPRGIFRGLAHDG